MPIVWHTIVWQKPLPGSGMLDSWRVDARRGGACLPLSADHFPERLSAVSGAAHDGAFRAALVRRRSGGVEQLPAVFPGPAAGWLRVRALAGIAAQHANARRDP